MLEAPGRKQLIKLFPDNALVHVAKYPNDSLKGLFTLNDKQARGKLDGAARSSTKAAIFIPSHFTPKETCMAP